MGRTIRSVLAVVAGFIAASVVMMLVETINGRVLYPEMGKAAQGVIDPQEIRALMASAPVGALVVVLVGWVLGSLVGGFLAARIGGGGTARLALILGAVLTVAGILNNLMLPPPMWFWVLTLVVFLPSAWAGGRLAAAKQPFPASAR